MPIFYSLAPLYDGSVTAAKLAAGAVTEAKITLADNTTNNVSITKHGFCPKAPNDTSKFLRGDGSFEALGVSETGSNVFRDGIAYDSIIAGTWDFNNDTAAWYAGMWRNSSFAQNDEISYKVYLTAGTYTLWTLGKSDTTMAIWTITIDGNSIGTLDYYGGSVVRNTIKSITGISVASSGIKLVNIKAATKNASSSDYHLGIQRIAFARTA